MNRRGSVLILALWTTAFVAFLAVTLSGKVRQNVFFYQKLDERERVRLAAEAGAKATVDRLRAREQGAPYSLKESGTLARRLAGEINRVEFSTVVPVWADPEDPGDPDLSGASPAAPASGLLSDDQNQAGTAAFEQKPTEIDLNGQKQTTTYGILDEARKINLNRADRFLLVRLFKAAGAEDELAVEVAAQTVDYRDADDAVTATAGAGGSEESRYRAAGLGYGPKNSDFEFVSELLRVPGMTEALYARIRPFVTVYGDGAVNLNTAGREVMSLIDVHPALAAKIFLLRAGPDRVEGTEDDVVFESQAGLEAKLKASFALRLQEQMSLRHAFARRLVTLSSNYFSVESVATAKQSRGRTLCVYGLRRGIQRWMEPS